MQDPNQENTIPTHPNRPMGDTVPNQVSTPPAGQPPVETPAPAAPSEPVAKARKRHRWPWIVLGIVLILLMGGLGTWLGYQSAIRLRQARAEEQKVTVATEHFMLGIQAQENKQYEVARQQFEYVIRLDPNFPGAVDKLREVMIAQAATATPTIAPTVATPTLTPTRDTRPQEEILATARQQFANQEWDNLFATIDSLRAIDPGYNAVEVDGMLYFALRFRGVRKILNEANLEGGIYDLALAEKFGPLDTDALGYRNWARLYLNGASFWEADWAKVVSYFEEIYPYIPNLRDGSGYTALDRYRIAAREQGHRLRNSGDPCGALEYYAKSLGAMADGELEVTATAVYEECYPPTATPTITPTLPTFTPTVAAPVTAAPVETTPPAPAPTEPPPVVETTAPPPAPTEGTPENP